MPSLKDEDIDRMADGFVGLGAHRDIPEFGFDPDARFAMGTNESSVARNRVQGDLNAEPVAGRSASLIPQSEPPAPASDLPDEVREILGFG